MPIRLLPKMISQRSRPRPISQSAVHKSMHAGNIMQELDDLGDNRIGMVDCILNTEEAAQTLAYHATRNHVEKYNISIGTGLITDSIPALEEVLVFWRGLSGEYEDLSIL